jgi:transcription elongation factor GreA
VRPGYNRVLAEEFEALKVKRVALVADKVEAHSQGDLRENFGFKAAKDAIRAVDRKMTALDRFVARNTFIEVDPAPGSPSRPTRSYSGTSPRWKNKMSRRSESIASHFS